MIKYEFHFDLAKTQSRDYQLYLASELRRISSMCYGHQPDFRFFKGDWTGLVMMLAKQEEEIIGFSFANMFEDSLDITACVHPDFDQENLEYRLIKSLKFSREWRLLWRRSKIPAALLPSRLLN